MRVNRYINWELNLPTGGIFFYLFYFLEILFVDNVKCGKFAVDLKLEVFDKFRALHINPDEFILT